MDVLYCRFYAVCQKGKDTPCPQISTSLAQNARASGELNNKCGINNAAIIVPEYCIKGFVPVVVTADSLSAGS